MRPPYRILEYDGPIYGLRRWCQELQNYHFVGFHRPASMMVDVDALNRGPYHKVSTMYHAMVAGIRKYDSHYNDKAYDITIYNTILEKGKLNLKKVSLWTNTEVYSLRAATLLTSISKDMGKPSTVPSDIVDSCLTLFSNEDSSLTSPPTAAKDTVNRGKKSTQ